MLSRPLEITLCFHYHTEYYLIYLVTRRYGISVHNILFERIHFVQIN